MSLDIYKGKKVLITGHTGFKGSWLTCWLLSLGAEVIGFSLKKYDNDIMFNSLNISNKIIDIRGDIFNKDDVKEVFDKYSPDFVFHLAAQPLVRLSYEIPLQTYYTNTIGTLNVLENIKNSKTVTGAVLITTDKVYKNKETEEGYKEENELGGYDPYSNSKACCELIIQSYRDSFFRNQNKYVASVRAGNVIGGGDFSKDRLIPDCIKALQATGIIKIRNPESTRPWQHVIEPLYGYLLIGAKMLNKESEYAEGWNFGPEKEGVVTVKEISNKIVDLWGSGKWECISDETFMKETKKLVLNIDKARNKLGWKPKLSIDEALKLTVDWYKAVNKYHCTMDQIKRYEKAIIREQLTCKSILKYKESSFDSDIVIKNEKNEIVGFLYPIKNSIEKKISNSVNLLTKWRRDNSFAFIGNSEISEESTRMWMNNNLIGKNNRILFFILSKERIPIGHIGLYSFNYFNSSYEIDNVVRGEKYIPGIMTFALKKLISWSREEFNLYDNILLRVLNDNEHAISFYLKNNFVIIGEEDIHEDNRKFIVMKWVI